jgi:hypothetical protein
VRGELLVSVLVKMVRHEYDARWGLKLQPEVRAGALAPVSAAVEGPQQLLACVGAGVELCNGPMLALRAMALAHPWTHAS